MSELKPCPFCGADNGYVDVIPNPFSNDIYSRGHCIKCHAVGTFYVQSYLEGELRPSFEQMAQMATEQWNTRPIEDKLRKRIAELESAQRWTPLEDPPKFDGRYLLRNIYGDVYSSKYVVKTETWVVHDFAMFTHWMPLPEPPEVQE